MIDSEAPVLSVRRLCELLGSKRSSFYCQAASESALNLQLMHLIDEQYLRTPFYGWPKMTAYLRRQGFAINGKRVRRLMSQMGIRAIYTKKKTSSTSKGHKYYPYLLRNLPIRHVNQVWSADITNIAHRLNGITRSDQRRPQPSGRTLFFPFRGLVIGANHN